MPESFQSFLTHFQEIWGHLPRQAKIIIPIVAVTILGGLIALSFWSSGDEWEELYSGLSPINLSNVREYLEARGVQPRIEIKDSSVWVQKGLAPNLRIQISYDGVIAGEDGDLLNVSESSILNTPDEIQLRKQRNAERKLQRSIESLRPVYKANVNLTLATNGVFVGEDLPAKAAVNLKLHPGESLSPQQINAIHKLIANSVSGLSTENITILDSQGNLLIGDDISRSQMDKTLSHWDYQQQQAKDFERSIKNVLTPIVGSEADLRVGVQVESDFDQIEQTTRTYMNEDTILLQEETTDETAQGTIDNGLPPGTSSNVVADSTLNAGNGNGPLTIQRKQNKKEYQPSMTETRTREALGTVKRVTAAVTINEVNPGGWSTQDISKFEDLVKSAIGFDQKRGDLVTVSSFPFKAKPVSTPISLSDRVLVYLPDLAKYAVIGLLGFILLMLLRSVMRTLHIGEPMIPVPVGPGMEPLSLDTDEGNELSEQTARMAGDEGNEALPEGGMSTEPFALDEELGTDKIEMQQLQALVEQMAQEDPEAILRVVQSWLTEDHTEFDLIDDEE